MRALLAAALVVCLGTAAHAGSPAEEAQKLIKKLTRDKNAENRANAAERLGNMKAAEAVPFLAAALKDKESSVRSSAAGALLEMGEAAKDAQPALQEALLDSDSTTVWNAAGALHNMGVVTTDLLPAYRRLLNDHDCDMRISAANAISEYATPAELMPIALDCRNTPTRDFADGDDVRHLMATIAKDKAAIPLLAQTLERDPDWEVREWAAKALGDQGTKARSAIPALKGALQDRDDRVRTAAERALARVSPKN
jgi:HEAT repeat protein